MPLLDRLTVVLISPQTPENVGSIARAMANFGLDRLVVAGSPGIVRDPGAFRLAVHSDFILQGAQEVADFEEARPGFDLVLGTTAHEAYETWDILEPQAAVALAREVPGPVALVFGSERYGLSKADLRRCDQVVHLPTARPGQSLNLAQAVLVFLWEFWRTGQGTADPEAGPPVPALAGLETVGLLPPGPDVLGELGIEWELVLAASGFLKPHNREKKLATLRRVLSRLRLTPVEVASLRGMGSKLALFCGQRPARRRDEGMFEPRDPGRPPGV